MEVEENVYGHWKQNITSEMHMIYTTIIDTHTDKNRYNAVLCEILINLRF